MMENKEIKKIVVPTQNRYSTIKLSEEAGLARDDRNRINLHLFVDHEEFVVPVIEDLIEENVQITEKFIYTQHLKRNTDGSYCLEIPNTSSKYFDSSNPNYHEASIKAQHLAEKYDKLFKDGSFHPYFKMEDLQEAIAYNSNIGEYHIDELPGTVLLKIAGIPNVVEVWRNTPRSDGRGFSSSVMTYERLADTPWELTKKEIADETYHGGRNQPIRSNFKESSGVKENLGEKGVESLLIGLYGEIKYRQNQIIEHLQAQKELKPSLENIKETIQSKFDTLSEISDKDQVRKFVSGR